ncbi:MAG: hypothetical protein ABI626_10725 [Sphingomicrobium sp.]
MNRHNWAKTLAAAVTAVSVAPSSIASASPASVRSIDPLVALSVFGSAQSRSAMCAATAAAVTAAAAQLPAQGCVLPVADTPPPVVSEAPPPPLEGVPAPMLAASASLLPFFVGLGAVAALVLLLDRGNSGRIVFHVPVPNSPT